MTAGVRKPELTLGEWIGAVDEFGWRDERVVAMFVDCARLATTSLGGGDLSAEEFVSELIVKIADALPAGWRDPRRRDVPLTRWLSGIVRKLRRPRPRRGQVAASALATVAAPEFDDDGDGDDDAPPSPPLLDIRPEEWLTPKQLASWRLHHDCGFGSRRAARELGISRDAHRARIRQARVRLRSSGVVRPPLRPAWKSEMAVRAQSAGDTLSATLLLLRCAGESYAQCATSLDLTVDAVRSRMARQRRVWRTSLPARSGDT